MRLFPESPQHHVIHVRVREGGDEKIAHIVGLKFAVVKIQAQLGQLDRQAKLAEAIQRLSPGADGGRSSNRGHEHSCTACAFLTDHACCSELAASGKQR